MCNDLDTFTNVVNCTIAVRTAGNIVKVTKKGTVKLEVRQTSGKIVTLLLNNILYMPSVFVNLLSSTKLARHGYSMHTGEGVVIRTSTLQEAFALKSWGNHWQLDVVKRDRHAAVASEVQHSRFSHVLYKLINKTSKQVTGLTDKVIKPDVNCSTCRQAKAIH